MMPLSFAQQFKDQGYYVAKGLLNPSEDLFPLKRTMESLICNLAKIYLSELPNQDISKSIEEKSFPEKFGIMLGASKGAALHHLDPVLNLFLPKFRWRRDLPDTRTDELFALQTHPKVLDVMQEMLGTEITATPLYHVNFKLASADLQLADHVAGMAGASLGRERFYNFQVGKTNWHMDASTSMPDSHDTPVVNAWIPLTHANEENGCLRVVPGSHQNGILHELDGDDLERKAISLIVEPGDVIILDNRIIHSSVPNISKADYRWAYNFRYAPTGLQNGRPFLPGFVARSQVAPQTVLRDPETWRLMWIRALDYISAHGTPVSFRSLKGMSLADAQAISKKWETLVPDVESWLKLGQGESSNTPSAR